MKRVLLGLFILLACHFAEASHYVAGHIGYKHISGDTFLIQFFEYRQCEFNNGPARSLTKDVWLISDCGDSNLVNLRLDTNGRVNNNEAYISEPVCDSTRMFRPCEIAEYRFEGKTELSQGCNWTISVILQQLRPVTNLKSFSTLHLESYINRKNASKNSAPKFLGSPSGFLGVGKPYAIGASDEDNDCLSYEFVCTEFDQYKCYDYELGTTSWEPIPSIHVDSASGLISLDTVKISGSFCVTVLIREFDNTGSEVGRSYRNLLLQCEANWYSSMDTPAYDSIQGANVLSTDPLFLDMTVGDTLQFNMRFAAADSLSRQWNFLTNFRDVLPGAKMWTEQKSDSIFIRSYYWPSRALSCSDQYFTTKVYRDCLTNEKIVVHLKLKPNPQTIGVDEFAEQLSVHPNPTKGILNVNSSIPIQGLELWSIDGRRLRSYMRNQSELDLSDFGQGIYLLQVNSKSGQVVKRIVLQ